jgi:dienelactone hydrolase
MVGQLATDNGRPDTRPGVLVCHEGGGLDEHAKGRAERLAEAHSFTNPNAEVMGIRELSP